MCLAPHQSLQAAISWVGAIIHAHKVNRGIRLGVESANTRDRLCLEIQDLDLEIAVSWMEQVEHRDRLSYDDAVYYARGDENIPRDSGEKGHS